MRKTQKNRMRRIRVGAGIAAAFFAVSTLLSSSQLISAEEKVQSAERIEVNLTHSHTSVCNHRTFVECGGHWCTNFEPYVGATVYYCSNNMAIPEIHDNYTLSEHSGTHDGEYVTVLNCSMSSIGKMVIEKTQTQEGTILQAFVEDPDNCISDYSITWENVDNEGDAEETPDEENTESTVDTTAPVLSIVRNGVYTATISVTDAKTGVTHEQSLSYTDVSFPIHLYLKSDGAIVAETDLYYGEALPVVAVPEKTGYFFEGYECNGNKIYDENGNPMPNVSTFWDEMEYESDAIWTAKTYTIHYGPDEDGDGIGDLEMQVTFGEPYAPIEPLEDQGSSTFTGFYYGNEQIFDREGNPTGVWSWDVEDGFTLQPKYYTPSSGSDSSDSSDSSPVQPTPSPSPTPTPTPSAGEQIGDAESVSDNSLPQGELGTDLDSTGGGDAGNGNTNNGNIGNRNTENTHSGGTNRFEDNARRRDWENSLYWGYGLNENGIGMYSRHGFGYETADTENNSIVLITEEENSEAESEEVELQSLLTENGEMEANTLKSHHQKEQIKKVLLITSSTVAGTAAVGGIIYSFFLFWISAGVYSITPQRKRKRLGYVVVNRGQDGFRMSIPQRLLDCSDTGDYLIRMPKGFVRNNIGKEFAIHLPNRKITDVIREEVTFSIR